MPQQIDELFYTIGGRTAPLVRSLGAAQGSLKKFTSFLKGPGGPIAAVGLLGAAFVAMAAKATAAAADLDKEMRTVATLLPETADELRGVQRQIVDLSERVPQPPVQLTRALYQAVSAGARDTSEALAVVEASSKAAVAGLTDSFTAVDAITTILNAYGKSAEEAAAVSDVLFATVERGKITFPELAQSIGTVVTTAAQAGISVEEVGAAFATLTKRGLDSRVVATSLNRLFLSFIKQTDEAAAVTEELGLNLNAAAVQQKGLAGIMAEVNEATGGQIEKLAEVNPNIRALRAALVLASDEGLKIFREDLQRTSTAQGTAAEAFREVTGAADEQWQLFKNKVNAIFLELGEHTLPLLIGILQRLNEIMMSDTEMLIQNLERIGEKEAALRLRAEETREALSERSTEIATETQQIEAQIDKLLERERVAARSRQIGATIFGPGVEDVGLIDELRGAGLSELEELGLRTDPERALTFIEDRINRLSRMMIGASEQEKLLITDIIDLRLEQARKLNVLIKRRETLQRLQQESEEQRRQEREELLAPIPDASLEAVRPFPLGEELLPEREPEVEIKPKVDEEDLEAAQQTVEELLAELELLREFGFEDALEFGDLPDEMEAALEAIQRLREERDRIQLVIDEEGRTPQLERALANVNERLDEQQDKVEELRGDTDIWLTEAEEKADELTESFRLLERLGLEGISALDGPAGDQIEELGRLEKKIEELGDVIEKLPEGERRDAAQRLLQQFRRQRDELVENISRVDQLGDAMDQLEGVELDLIGDLDQRQFSILQGVLAAVAEEMEAVEDARRELEIAELTGDTERAADAAEELEAAEAALEEQLQRVERVLRAAGIEGEELAAIMRALRGDTEGAEDATSSLQDKLSTFQGLARGVLSVARAMGVLSDDAEQALEGVIDLAEGIGRIAAGDIVGGVAQGLGGLIGAIGGLFGGESEEERRERERLASESIELSEALSRLRRSAEELQQVFESAAGGVVAAVRQVFAELDVRGELFEESRSGGTLSLQPLLADLEAAGVSRDEFIDFLETLPGDFSELIGLLEGRFNQMRAAGEASTEGILRELEAVQRATAELELSRVFETFRGQLDLLQQEFDLLDIEDPLDQLRRLRELMLEFTDLPEEFRAQLAGANLETEVGRRQFEAALENIFKALASGELGPGAFGQLTVSEFRSLIGDLEGTLDTAQDELGDLAEGEEPGTTTAFQVSRQITEVTANRLVGTLTTISILNQQQLRVLRGILAALGGEVPGPGAGGVAAGGETVGIAPVDVDPVPLRPPTAQQVEQATGGGGVQVSGVTFDTDVTLAGDGVPTGAELEERLEQIADRVNQRLFREFREFLRSHGDDLEVF